MVCAANGNVHLVCRGYAKCRIAKLPPELMTDYGYIQCRAWLDCILNRENNAGCGKKQHNDDQDGDHCPRKFQLVTAINLWRLSLVFTARSVSDNHKDK